MLDASEAVIAYSDMMRSRISMPARLMGNIGGVDLFKQFSVIAENLGVYTSEDYISIIEHLNKRWGVANLKGLSSGAEERQQYVCELPNRLRRAASRKNIPKHHQASQAFDWVIA